MEYIMVRVDAESQRDRDEFVKLLNEGYKIISAVGVGGGMSPLYIVYVLERL